MPFESFYDLVTLLDFEASSRSSVHTMHKEARIISTFNTSAARYYDRLGRLIDTPEALRHNPLLVNRLIEQRAARAVKRAARAATSSIERTHK